MILDGQCGAFNPVLLQCLKDCEKQILAEFSDSIDTTQDDRLLIRATEELVENKISSDKIDFSAHLPIAARDRWNFSLTARKKFSLSMTQYLMYCD